MIYAIYLYSTGKLLGYQKNPRYIKFNSDSGTYIQTNANDYDGISINNGTLYNILGHERIKDTEAVVLREVDEAELINNLFYENNQFQETIRQQQLDIIEMTINMQYENDLAKEPATNESI